MGKYVFNFEGIESIEDSLVLIENSLQIKFEEKELIAVNTFEDLIVIAIAKLNQEDSDTCTSQLLFYKLKVIFNKYGLFNPEKLTPDTKLSHVFPRKYRKTLAKLVKKELGTGVDIVCLSNYTTTIFLSLILGSIMAMVSLEFIVGFTLFVLLSTSFCVANRFTTRLKFKTVRELIEYILFYEYVQSRKDSSSINRKELKRLLLKIYSKELDIDKNILIKTSFVR